MIKVFLLCIAFCGFFLSVGIAQTISGKVSNTAGEPINNAQILLKDSVSAFQFKEFFFATNGAYSFQPKQAYPNLVVEINAMGYKKARYIIEKYERTQTYTHDFVLEIETESLGEVVVTASKRYEQREDTISYNVSAYRDGTEKKIEDLIKKLPGMEVNERTGQIKYNGKAVETVNLDGDNLFDKSYAIGTRNIDVDMVEQVQALENYSENPLLKGVESGEKVALNLVLKKTGIKFSGSAEVGLGAFASDRLQRATDFSSNVLGITQKFKGFATLSHNNIGTNNTPYDYAGYSVSEEMQDPAMFAPRYIPDTYFSVGIDAKRNNFNNTLFNSVNMLFKPSKRLSVKVNLLYLHDKITSEQFSQNDFSFNNEVFSTSDRLSIRKTPNRYIGKLELKYTLSSKSMIEYHGSYDVENIRTSTEVLQNNTNLYSTRLQSDAHLLRQALIYTYRLSKNKAIQLTATHILHKTPQEYLFLPAIYEAQTYSANNQTSAFEKNYTEIKAQLLGKIEKEGENGRVIMPNRDKNKYDLSVVAIRQVSNFNTDLWGDLAQGAQAIPSFRNRGLYKRYTAFANTGYKWVLGRWVIQPSAKASVMQQGVQDFVTAQDYAITQFIFEPLLNLRYKLGDNANVFGSAGYKQNPFSEEYFIQNPVYISNRTLKANEISLQLQQQQTFTLGYSFRNMERHFRFSLMGTYTQNMGNYFNKLTIQTNSTSDISFFLPEGAETRMVGLAIEKYTHAIKSTIRLRSNYSLRDYKNLVGNLTLRSNQASSWSNDLFFKTAFDIRVNFENTFRYNTATSQTEGGNRFANQSLSNNFQIIVKPKKGLLFVLSQDYFLQDVNKPAQAYYFADLSCRYITKKLTWQFYLKNITNTRYFQQVSVNDFSSFISQTNLLPRHFLVSTGFSF